MAVAGILATIRNPAGRSLVPVLVDAADAAPANALFGLGRTLTLTVGPGLGGLLGAAPGGAHTALAVDAATFLASALLLRGLPAIAPARDPGADTGVWAEAGEGLRYVVANRQISVLVLGLFLLVAFAAVDNVALILLTGDVIHAGPAGYGVAASAFGVGMVLASLACTRLALGRRPIALLIVAVVATGAGTVVNGLARFSRWSSRHSWWRTPATPWRTSGTTLSCRTSCPARFSAGCSAPSALLHSWEPLSPTRWAVSSSVWPAPVPPSFSPAPGRSWS